MPEKSEHKQAPQDPLDSYFDRLHQSDSYPEQIKLAGEIVRYSCEDRYDGLTIYKTVNR